MVQKIGNSGFTQNLSDAYASVSDAAKNHPKTALAAGIALASLAAYAINPSLFALTQTESAWLVANRTSPTLLGKAWNFIASNPNETVTTIKGLGWETGKTGRHVFYAIAAGLSGLGLNAGLITCLPAFTAKCVSSAASVALFGLGSLLDSCKPIKLSLKQVAEIYGDTFG